MKKYVALALSLVWVDGCVQPPLPPEPPITVVISQCRGTDAGGLIAVEDPKPGEPKAPPSDPEVEVTSRR